MAKGTELHSGVVLHMFTQQQLVLGPEGILAVGELLLWLLLTSNVPDPSSSSSSIARHWCGQQQLWGLCSVLVLVTSACLCVSSSRLCDLLVLHCTVLGFTVLYCAVLYWVVLYRIVPHCAVLGYVEQSAASYV
jgi:hypothetical protein